MGARAFRPPWLRCLQRHNRPRAEGLGGSRPPGFSLCGSACRFRLWALPDRPLEPALKSAAIPDSCGDRLCRSDRISRKYAAALEAHKDATAPRHWPSSSPSCSGTSDFSPICCGQSRAALERWSRSAAAGKLDCGASHGAKVRNLKVAAGRGPSA